jgi:hypothetical protein
LEGNSSVSPGDNLIDEVSPVAVKINGPPLYVVVPMRLRAHLAVGLLPAGWGTNSGNKKGAVGTAPFAFYVRNTISGGG